MEQRSDVIFRAEKEYKNGREKFSYLLREIVSNSIHAVLIREKRECDFTPNINLKISFDDDKCKIELRDNGDGFTEINSECFEQLDKKNPDKERMNFHPLGQGRLAIVYFSDTANYETVYKDGSGNYKKRNIPYPYNRNEIFGFDLFSETPAEENDSYTLLKIDISKQGSYNRAKTFFKKYSDIKSLKLWFIETFFPFIVNNEKLEIEIVYNGDSVIIKKETLENEIEPLNFNIDLDKEQSYTFNLWLIKTGLKMKGEQLVECFARNLKAEMISQKIAYELESEEGYHFYLTSTLFDENVDTKGERIEIENNDAVKINDEITKILDAYFKKVIQKNQNITKKNLKDFEKKFPSLEAFVDKGILENRKMVANENEILKNAVEKKSQIEKKFWSKDISENENAVENSFEDSEDCQKLLNSSLHIYVKHRERVLDKLHKLIQMFDAEGNDKPELESKVHELFFKRGTTLSSSSNTNHLHNLWILDDKFTIFSNNFKAQSTKNGQSASDIYIWADDPEKTKEILIVELKSTTKAHNAGSKEEGMIAQVKRYAQDFYEDSTKYLNWRVDTKNVLFAGYILANRDDIRKELRSPQSSGRFRKIPFLENSYYSDESFTKPNVDDPMDSVPIRIELYSFEDIYELASSRNAVFFKLLKNEFLVTET